MTGPIGDELLAKVSASPAKLVAIGWMDGGARSLYTKKPVRTPADLKGQKVRMMGNPLFVDTMNAMGGNGISMGYGECSTALQTGVVDGAENNAPSYFTSNPTTTRGAKYYTQTNHLIIPELLVVSKATWDKLSKDDQALLKKFGREAQMEQRTLWDKSVAENTARLKSAGVEFIAVDNKPFYEATAPVRAKYGANYARSDQAHRGCQVTARQPPVNNPCFVSWAMPLCGVAPDVLAAMRFRPGALSARRALGAWAVFCCFSTW